MNRRNFLKTTGTAASLAALAPAVSFASSPASFSDDVVKKMKDRIKPITSEERQQRIANARRLMKEHNLDAILIEGGTSLNYFTGARWGRSERLFAMVLPREESIPIAYISPKFEEGRALQQTGNAKILTWEEDQNPYELIKQIGTFGTLGIEETSRYFVADGIQKSNPGIRLQSATPVTAGCRSIKTAHEVELMEIANDMALHVFKATFAKLREGMTEREFGDLLTAGFAEFGSRGGALVLFGESSAYPHGLVKENRLKEGDIVLVDGGCVVEGYESDITRTGVFGKPTDKMKKVWDIVRKAQDAGLKAAKPGVPAEQVDAAARKVITDSGYGPGYKYFTHRLGHGIGMDGHEWHYLVGGNKHLLKTGNMFSNEPGIYIAGEFGIRLEDEMLITENGAKLLLAQQESLEKPF